MTIPFSDRIIVERKRKLMDSVVDNDDAKQKCVSTHHWNVKKHQINNVSEKSKTKKLKAKRVLFASKNQMFLLPQLDEDVRKEIWYSRNEFADFLRERLTTVHLLRMLNEGRYANDDKIRMAFNNSTDYCSRGLEQYHKTDLNRQIHYQRQSHQEKVFLEQRRQKRVGICDPETIQQITSQNSELSRLRAQYLALLDSEEEIQNSNIQSSTGTPKNVRNRESYIDTFNGIYSTNMSLQNQLFSPSMQTTILRTTPMLSTGRRCQVDVATLKQWNAQVLDDLYKQSS